MTDSGTSDERLLYASPRTRVTRVRRPDGATVIRKEALGADGARSLRHEVALLRRLAGVEGVSRLLEADPGGGAIVLADTGGRPLSEVVTEGGCDPVWVARFAAELARVVAAVHRAGVVHKDVNPANVLVCPDGVTPVLVDFDLATTFAVERPEFTHHDRIAGTFGYLAPEQTGRTGRAVDQRADLFAMGATLYELATGRPPFHEAGDDPLRLLHAHLATTPPSPHVVDPAVPAVLSDIVMRLLEKEPDQRYQSAEGLAHDLTRLVARLADGDPPTRGVFPLGGRDFPSRLSAPSRLVGRDAEIAGLAGAYRRLRTGAKGAATLLVAGAPGVGKSVLLDELRPMVTEDGGWFVTGKFDQFRQDVAADGARQALAGLGRLLLAEPEAGLKRYRDRLLTGLGPNAGLVTAEFPEFRALLGVPPERPEGDADELASRALRAGVDLLAAVASPERPVVMVLDDLQWAPAFPIRFLDAVLTDPRMTGVLVVGAYRDGEVDVAHPLSATQARWQRLGVAGAPLKLVNLPPAELSVLLSTMLRLAPARAGALADAVGERTGGNPYDTVELVNALRHDGVLVADSDGWRWDPDAIRRFVGAGDVTDLLAARIDRLPATTANLLRILACLGGDVDLPVVTTVTGLDADSVRAHLAPALEDGLLLAVQTDGGQEYDAVRFRHDRVQQTAYGRGDAADRRQRHLDLARSLAAAAAGDYAALAGEHYQHAVGEVTDPAELRRAVTLLLAAAADLRLVNPAGADRCLTAAVTALSRVDVAAPSDPALPADDELALELARERHAVLITLGRLEEADECYATITARVSDPVALADPADLQISSLTNRTRFAEAVALGTDLLGRLGVVRPDDLMGAVQEGLDRTIRWIDEDDPAQDPRPEIDDARILAAGKVMGRVLIPSFNCDPMVYAWLSTESQRLMAAHGPGAAVLPAAIGIPLLLVAFRGDYRRGHDLATVLVARARARGYRTAEPLAAIPLSVCDCWRNPLEESVVLAREAREGLQHLGQLNYAGITFMASIAATLDSAAHLATAAEEIEACLAFAARTGNDYIGTENLLFRQLVRALRGETAAPGSLDDEEFDSAGHLAAAGTQTSPVFLHCYGALAAAVFGDTAALRTRAAAAMAFVPRVPGFYLVAVTHVLQALSLAEQVRAEEPGGAERERLLAELGACRDWLAVRAADAPVNFAHLVPLVDAERAWATGDVWAAARAFDEAQQLAATRCRPWHRALITERAAVFHLATGLRHAGEGLLAEARRLWLAWGATGKVRELDRAHPFLRAGGSSDSGHTLGKSVGRGLSAGHRLAASAAESIDLLGVLKASQALSTETDVDRLRERVVAVLTAMTGATGVHLALWNDESADWHVPAPGAGARGAVVSVTEAGAQGLLPLSAFRYAERTREPLRVDDATADDRFARDPYLTALDCCSLLVVPVLAHGAPRAMLVLENRLSRGAFSPDRLDAVLLIAGQLAVSLDNALAERFRSLVQRSNDLILVAGRDAVISYASVAAVDLVGLDRTALTGRSVADLLHAEDRVELLDVVRRAGPGEVETRQLRVMHADGSARRVEATVTDLTGDAAVRGVMVHLRDITERHRLETELRHAQKLESIGQLSAGIAHEINTPIQFIADNLRFLSDAFAELSGVLRPVAVGAGADGAGGASGAADVDFLLDEIPQALADTVDGTSRVATIVRAMKSLGHPGGEGKAHADLNDAIRNTLIVAANEIRPVADVVTDLADLPPVWCNIGDINQVLLNLVVNAAHAMADQAEGAGRRGTLTIRTRHEGDDVVVEIQDSGSGIPADIADRVFDQFFTTKDVGVGTGQGLALAHTLIHDHHDGTIGFRSSAGEGTTFTIRLPNPAPDMATG